MSQSGQLITQDYEAAIEEVDEHGGWKAAVLCAMLVATAAGNASSLSALAAHAAGRRRRRRRQTLAERRGARRQAAAAAALVGAGSPTLTPPLSSPPSSSPSPSSRMYFFLFHLSVADALTAPLTLLPELLWTLAAPGGSSRGGERLEEGGEEDEGHLWWRELVCRGTKYIQMFAPYLSSYLLVVMAVDRYGAICYPMRQRRRAWRPRDSRRRVAQVWALALALCTPQAIVFGGDGDGDGDGGVGCAAKFHDGWQAKLWVTWFAATSFFLPLSAMSYSYARICAALRANLRAKTHDWRISGRAGGGAGKAGAGLSSSGVHRCCCGRRNLDRMRKSTTINEISCNSLHRSAEEQEKHPLTNSFFLFHHNHHYHNHHFGVPSFIYPSAAAATAAIVAADPAADAATGGGSFRPRSHSGIEGISRAKIKSVRQTVVIIAGYIACSAPAIAFQMWAVWIKEEKNLTYSTEWFFWLVTLNSILNPWIYLALNRDLQDSLRDLCCPCGRRGHGFASMDRKTSASSEQNLPTAHRHPPHQDLFRPRSLTVEMGPDGRPRRKMLPPAMPVAVAMPTMPTMAATATTTITASSSSSTTTAAGKAMRRKKRRAKLGMSSTLSPTSSSSPPTSEEDILRRRAQT